MSLEFFFNATRFIIFNPQTYQNSHLFTGWQLITPVALKNISNITVQLCLCTWGNRCALRRAYAAARLKEMLTVLLKLPLLYVILSHLQE